MSDLIVNTIGGIIGFTLLVALINFIWFKIWPRAKSKKCKIVREDDSYAIYDSFFPSSVNPIGHIYIKNSRAEVHIRKDFEDDEIVDYEPIESWIADDEVFKGNQVGVKDCDESVGKLSFEAVKSWGSAFFSQYDFKATIEKPSVKVPSSTEEEKLVVPDDVDLDPNDDKEAPSNPSETKSEPNKDIIRVCQIYEFGKQKSDVDKLFPLRKLLCGYLAIEEDIHKRLDTTIADGGYQRQKPKWSDTGYLAFLIFTIIYSLYIVFFPAPEDLCPKKFLPYLFAAEAVYFVIWIILYEIHYGLTFINNKSTHFLRMLNRCTGLRGTMTVYFLFILAGAVLSFYKYDWIYLEFYFVVGFLIRLCDLNFSLWKVDDPLIPMLKQNEIDDNKIDDGADDPNPNSDLFQINHYNWSVSGMNTNSKILLKLKFDIAETARLMVNNDNSEFLNSNADPGEIARYFVETEKNSLHIKKLCWFVDSTTKERGLSHMQKMQLILDFVQDRESFERVEYPLTSSGRLRSSEEILFSKKATAMDRAQLASTIYATMGYKVNILQSRDGRIALEVADKENVCTDLCGVIRNDVFSYNDQVYYVCDMQADNFVIGTIPSFKKSDFVKRIVIA